MIPFSLVLASSSPRRAALLRALGLDVTIVAPRLDEAEVPGEAPEAHAVRLAAGKASAVARALPRSAPTTLVLAADTVVVGDRLLGKPCDADDARRMLRQLSGRAHDVLTAVHLVRCDDGASAATLERTSVRFRTYDDRWIDWYVGTREPFGKAGAYSIQGLGALLCERLDGSWSNVVGLPVEVLPALFAQVGVDFLARLERATTGTDVDLGVLSSDAEERTS